MSSHEPRRSDRPDSSRRRFLKAAASSAVAASLGPVFARASDKTGSKKPIIGSGDYQYEVTHGWGELPDDVQWGDTHGVCIDRDGLIYMKHRSAASEPMDAIVVFDPHGKPVRSFGKEYHGGGHGIDVRLEGNEEFLYLSDVKNCIVAKTTLTGEQVWVKGYPEEPGVYPNGEGYRPTNVGFSPDGGFYIGDGYGSSYMHQYDADANWVRTWGGRGTEPGKLQVPHGQWLDDRPGREPSLVVADRKNSRLQYFTLDGQHLGFVEGFGWPADIDIQGEVMLIPDLHARITLLDGQNNVIAQLGYDPEWTKRVLDKDQPALREHPEQCQPGRFLHPHDACFDKDGNIFVMEWVPTGRVSKLRRV